MLACHLARSPLHQLMMKQGKGKVLQRYFITGAKPSSGAGVWFLIPSYGSVVVQKGQEGEGRKEEERREEGEGERDGEKRGKDIPWTPHQKGIDFMMSTVIHTKS